MKRETPGGVTPGASIVLDDRMKLIALVQSIRASENDRKFFEKHSDRNHRIRPAYSSEIELAGLAPDGYRSFVAVRHIVPGVRCRLGFWALQIPHGVPEGPAAEIFERAMKNSGAIPEVLRSVLSRRDGA